LNFIATKDSGEAIRLINEIYDDGADIIEFSRAILKNLRKILLLKANPETEKILKDELTEDQLKTLKGLTEKFEIKELKKLMEEFLKAKEAIKHSPIPTLPLELIVFELKVDNK
jgi:DNA polymerase III gamma/tau subunit